MLNLILSLIDSAPLVIEVSCSSAGEALLFSKSQFLIDLVKGEIVVVVGSFKSLLNIRVFSRVVL